MRLIRQGQDPTTTAMTMLAMAILAATLIFVIVVPKPSSFGLERKYKNRAYELALLNKKAKDALTAKQAKIAAQTWNMPEQKVGPLALANVTALVRRNKLSLVSFRPQRNSQGATFAQIPYLLTVDGPYLAVIELCRQLEQPSTKLAVNVVQVASAEETSDRVTANIGLVAYLTPNEEAGTTKNG